MKRRVMSIRHSRVRALLDPIEGVGLEVGPLYDPLFTREEADIRYVDIHSAAELRAYYAADPNVDLDAIVEPDFIIIGPDGPRSLPEAVGGAAGFEWVVASHVVEHVPDLVGWLDEVAEVLADNGRLALVVPDRRFSFDAGRDPTTMGEILLAHHHRDRIPSVRAVYDHFSRAVGVSVTALWNGAVAGPDSRVHTIDDAVGKVDAATKNGEYVDCHVWLFTPESFVAQLAELGRLDLAPFTVERVIPTVPYELEFYVLLRRLPRGLDVEGQRRARASGISQWVDAEAEQPAAQGDELHLSRRELDFVRRKRATMNWLRGSLKEVRSRVPGAR